MMRLQTTPTHFSAKLVGTAKLPQRKDNNTKRPVTVYQLEADSDDIQFLANTEKAFNRGRNKLVAFICKLLHLNVLEIPIVEGVKPSFYAEHISETLAASKKALQNERQGQLSVSPLIHIAVSASDNRLLGINYSGKERTLQGTRDKLYTPLPIDLSNDPTPANQTSFETINHWGANYLVKVVADRRVGDALMIAMEKALPSNIRRVDLVSANCEKHYSKLAQGFYERYGFQARHDLRDQNIVGMNITFQKAFGDADALPMTVQRHVLTQKVNEFGEALGYRTIQPAEKTNLNTVVSLKSEP